MNVEHDRQIPGTVTSKPKLSILNDMKRIPANSAFQKYLKCAEVREKFKSYNCPHN